jgi:uncharacterized protein
MKFAIVGAGFVGKAIIDEALARGHDVTALVRSPEKLQPQQRLTVVKVDVHDTAALAQALRGHTTLVNAWSPGRGQIFPDLFDRFVTAYRSIIVAAKQARIARFLAVGGAGSLKARSGKEFIDSDEMIKDFEPFREGIRGTREQYYLLKADADFDWVFLAPSVMMMPGQRTARYRVGTDKVLYDTDGISRISVEDYAKAMIDELETPAHHRERFTVGY